MKREKYMTALIVVCVLSYFMMVNLSITADAADDLSNYEVTNDVKRRNTLISDLRKTLKEEKELIEYTQNLTNLDYDECEFILNESKRNNVDLFLILGIIKRESDFNPKAQGASGERGLGQLMENTAKPIADNLGYVYDPDKLYDPRYNLKLTITQISYLLSLYDNDIHKALTAYNRGQQGLIIYMESSEERKSAESDYSIKVLQFANEYKEGFKKTLTL